MFFSQKNQSLFLWLRSPTYSDFLGNSDFKGDFSIIFKAHFLFDANYGKNGNVTRNVTNVTKNLTNLENQVLELIKQGINTTKDLIVKTKKRK